jgi:glucokinase
VTVALRSNLRLVGDIGGTNARFALVDLASPAPRLLDPQGVLCADYPSLEAAIGHYLQGRPTATRPGSAVVAVAGPVVDGAAQLTNGQWEMSDEALRADGFGAARLINDYAALAMSLPRLGKDDLGAVGETVTPGGGSLAVLGAGTGLGVAALIRDGEQEAVAITEGGHIAFAPGDEIEVEILRQLIAEFGRASLERLLSGPGLVTLRQALGRIRKTQTPPLTPKEITDRAIAGSDPLCVETLDRFCAIYGAAAGDFALSLGAVGGVYLGGGIAPRIIDYLRASQFRARFEAKGRFRSYVAAIPTQVILHPYAALLGAAAAPLASPAPSGRVIR